jgi:predicted double-glycine peptidase
MKFQTSKGGCGPAAVVNALKVFGIKARIDVVAKNAGTTDTSGTTEHGIKQALERLDIEFYDIHRKAFIDAELDLVEAVNCGSPVICLAEAGNHWVTAIGSSGLKRIIFFDPQLGNWNKAEAGVHVVNCGDKLRRFWSSCGGKRYAIVVKGPKV